MNIPKTMTAWPLFGPGLENLGKDDQLCEVPVPDTAEDELLVRIDAIGLCFSDIKLIRAGEDHPRVISENLATDPVIPGHEAVMTVVRVGEKMKDQFAVGERYIIQADIYVNGKGFAYGYAIDGGMALYSRVDQRVLNGDEGCYLIPLADHIPAGLAALVEPWTCVIASYMIDHREKPAAGGTVLVAADVDSTKVYEPGAALIAAKPTALDAFNLGDDALAALRSALPETEIRVLESVPNGDQRYDDVFLCDIRDRYLAEALGKLPARDGVVNFIGDYPNETWSFDVGNIHYQGWFYQGTVGSDLSAGYGRNVRSKLRKGGDCWLLGGAGAMGQMHTQLAVENDDGPSRILVTDMDDERIENVRKLLSDAIEKRGIEFKTLNPGAFDSPDEFAEAVAEFAPDGFDDIVMLVPVVPVLNSAVPFLKEDGLMNIFAGIPAGKEAELDVGAIATKGVRYIGSSGSRTHHLKHTLDLVAEGELNTAPALAAIGGMKVLKKGLEGVANATFPGKTVIYPHCPELPLVPVHDLSTLNSELAETLEDGLFTAKTEKKLFELYGS